MRHLFVVCECEVFPTMTRLQLETFDVGIYDLVLAACSGPFEVYKSELLKSKDLVLMLQKALSNPKSNTTAKVESATTPTAAPCALVEATPAPTFPFLPDGEYLKMAVDFVVALVALIQRKMLNPSLDSGNVYQGQLHHKAVVVLTGQLATAGMTSAGLLKAGKTEPPDQEFDKVWGDVVAVAATEVDKATGHQLIARLLLTQLLC